MMTVRAKQRKVSSDVIVQGYKDHMRKTIETRAKQASVSILAALPDRVHKRAIDPAKLAALIVAEFEALVQ